jgi:hypothetical protein
MNFEWADGFHAPKGVSVEDVAGALDALPTPSPENLLEASKRKRHVLHGELWSEGDQVWAQRGRLERCRKIIGAVQEVIVVGNREIKVRAVEFVKTNGSGQWTGIESITSDPDLTDAYLAEIQRLQDQAAAKMARFRMLLKNR